MEVKHHPNFRDISGQRFGKLVAIKPMGKSWRKYRWLYLCDCGNEHVADHSNAKKAGHCGCNLAGKYIPQLKHTHTMHGLSSYKEYGRWMGIRVRCFDPREPKYSCYGGRGITVCKHWVESFKNFFDDMGTAPQGTTIDRIDNNLHYSCGHCDECLKNGWKANCRWATNSEQCNNTRRNRLLTVDGITKTVTEWSRHNLVSVATIRGRLRRGRTARECVDPIKRDRRKVSHRGTAGR